MDVKLSLRVEAGVLVGALALTGCSHTDADVDVDVAGGTASSSTPAVDSPAEVNQDFEQAVLGTVEASGMPVGEWRYAGGDIFGVEDFKSYVPQMSTYCGKREDGTELYNKDMRLEAEHRFTKEDYLKKSDEMQAYWESQGQKPYVVGSDSSSKKIAYKTEGGALIQFDAGENGLMIFADSACVLPGEPDPLAS